MGREPITLEAHLGAALHRRATELTRLWLDRLQERLEVSPRRIFPSEALLNHIPEVLKAVSDFICEARPGTSDEFVRTELAKLAHLRREQGYEIAEVLAELDILGQILFQALREGAGELDEKAQAVEAIAVSERLYRALMGMTSITADTFREEGFRDRRERARLLGDFGRNLAHELRNRLSTAEAALQILKETTAPSPETAGPGPSRREQTIRTLAASLQRIKGVADDVNALAIAQGSEETAQGRRLSLRTLVSETLVEVCSLAAERDLRLEVVEPIPDVQVDAARVELVLINLIGNAVKYFDPAKPDRYVRVGVQRAEDGFWRVSISDNGVGIPADMQHLVFEQFVRAHPEIAEGTGLGLAIAREAVSQLGGRIWLESQEGLGTAFHFTLLDPPSARA